MFSRMLLAVIAAAALTVPPLGGRSISTSHEARFALLARDIVERGAWFEARVPTSSGKRRWPHPTSAGEPRLETYTRNP